DLVRGVHDHDALPELLAEDASHLAQLRCLADAGPPENQDAAAGFDLVPHNVDGAEHSAADAAGEADDPARAVADRRDPVERALDPGAVVLPELADAGGDVFQVRVIHHAVRQVDAAS